jgi:hypothetical protein
MTIKVLFNSNNYSSNSNNSSFKKFKSQYSSTYNNTNQWHVVINKMLLVVNYQLANKNHFNIRVYLYNRISHIRE